MKFILNKLQIDKDLKELINHAKNYVSADIFAKGIAFLTLPIFTNILTTGEYGILSVFISYIAIIGIINSFGFRGAITRYYFEELKNKDFWGFFSSLSNLSILSGILLSFCVFVFADQLSEILKIPPLLIKLGVITGFPFAIYNYYLSYLQASKQSHFVSKLTIVFSLCGTLFTVLFMLLLENERYYAKAYSHIISVGILVIVTFWFLSSNYKLILQIKYIKYGLSFGIPIVVHDLSQIILSSFDQIIINQIVGEVETGLYSVAYKIGIIISVISLGFLKSYTPIFYAKLNEAKHDDINNLAVKYSYIVMFVAILLIVFSNELLILLTNKNYYSVHSLISIVVLSYYFHFIYTIYVNYLFYYKATKRIAYITLLVGVFNIVLNYVFIPKFGYEAAAWTTLISYILMVIAHYINVRSLVNPNELVSLRSFIMPTLMVVVSILVILFIEKNSSIAIIYSVKFLVIISSLIIVSKNLKKHA